MIDELKQWEYDRGYEKGKIDILNKIRAEIENDWQLKKYPSSPFSCGLRRAIEIIDKYTNHPLGYNPWQE